MLTIEVISYKERPLPRPHGREFDETGGTIGRSETSTLFLEDPERGNDGSAISRNHAQIQYQAGHYVIIDNGANPLRLNNIALGKGKEKQLADGDQLRIGDYVLQVHLGQTGNPVPGARVPRVEPTLGTLGTKNSRETGIDTVVSADSLRRIPIGVKADKQRPGRHDVTGGPTEDGDMQSRSRRLQKIEEQLGVGAPPLEPNLLPIPAPDLSTDARPTEASAHKGSKADGNLKQQTPPSGDMVVSWQQENAPVRPLISDVAESPTGTPVPQIVPRERASIKGATDIKTTSRGQGAHSVKSKWKAALPSDEAPLPDLLLQAFLAGAGNPKLALPQGLDAKTLFQLGELMRATVEGILQLLKVRSETKVEVGAKLTIIAPYVNPLKFSPDVDFALQQLLASQSQGFMPPLEAIHDAFSDLISHHVGLLAGLDAAMNALIDRFSPDKLERQLVEKGLLDAVIPFKEKAKLWDLFETKFDDIKDKAREGIDNVFKTEFVKAYENKVAELRRARMPDSGSEN